MACFLFMIWLNADLFIGILVTDFSEVLTKLNIFWTGTENTFENDVFEMIAILFRP